VSETRALRWVRRSCLGGAALFGMVALLGPTVAGADSTSGSSRPDVFAGVAAATAIHQEANGQAGIGPTSQPFYGSFPDGLSQFSASGTLARASTYWPGATVNGLGGLLCVAGFTPGCGLPPFPLSAQTSGSPPDVRTAPSQNLGGGGAPASLTALSAAAHADPNLVSTDAVDGGYTLGTGGGGASSAQAGQSLAAASLGFRRQVAAITGSREAAAAVKPQASDGTVAQVASSESHTKQSFAPSDPSTLVVHAETQLSGVDLLGGMIHVDTIQATSDYQANEHGTDKHVDHVTVHGVTAGGQPASIDQNGVTVGGSTQGGPILDAINSALQTALQTSGSQVHLVGDTANPPQPIGGTGCGKAEADGLLVHLQADASQVPTGDLYFTDLTLGSACTAATTSAQLASDLGGVGAGGGGTDLGTATGPTAASTGSADQGAALSSSAGVPGTPGSPATPGSLATSSPGRRGAHATPRSGSGFFGEIVDQALVAHRLDAVYLAFTLAFAGLFLGSRLLIPARLPRGR
jgi:flagellar basal body rod protein FlgC